MSALWPPWWGRYAEHWNVRRCPHCRTLRPPTGGAFCEGRDCSWMHQEYADRMRWSYQVTGDANAPTAVREATEATAVAADAIAALARDGSLRDRRSPTDISVSFHVGRVPVRVRITAEVG